MGHSKPRSWTLPAFNPHNPNDEPIEVWLDQAHIDGLTKRGLETRFARIQLIPEVLKSPRAIFQGLKREEQEDGLCYAGVPDVDHRNVSITVPPPKSMVFLVFITACNKISDWRWEKCDKDALDCPENYRTRFEKILWPTQQTL